MRNTDNNNVDDDGEEGEEESTNIVDYHLSVHMFEQKKEQGTVTTVVVSNIVVCCLCSRIQFIERSSRTIYRKEMKKRIEDLPNHRPVSDRQTHAHSDISSSMLVVHFRLLLMTSAHGTLRRNDGFE